jgi:phosphatidylglycerol---prolipoprotein diacylglyceryl transferase
MLPQDFNLPLAVLAQIRWDVSPVIFNLGPLPIRWYSLGWILAFGMGFFLVQRTYRKEGKPEQDLETILLYMVLGAIIGARLGHCLFYRPDYYLANPVEIFAFWKGFQGLSSHGGTIGILVSLFIFTRRHPDQPYFWLLDRIAAPTALGGFFIRMGNLMNSEILGLPTDVPWAMVFVRVDNLPRHPAQLYEAVAYGVIFVLLFLLQRRRGPTLPTGTLTGAFLALVFTARILIEFVKERHAPFELGLPLSMGQILSIPMVAAGLVLIWWVRRERTPAPRPR